MYKGPVSPEDIKRKRQVWQPVPSIIVTSAFSDERVT